MQFPPANQEPSQTEWVRTVQDNLNILESQTTAVERQSKDTLRESSLAVQAANSSLANTYEMISRYSKTTNVRRTFNGLSQFPVGSWETIYTIDVPYEPNGDYLTFGNTVVSTYEFADQAGNVTAPDWQMTVDYYLYRNVDETEALRRSLYTQRTASTVPTQSPLTTSYARALLSGSYAVGPGTADEQYFSSPFNYDGVRLKLRGIRYTSPSLPSFTLKAFLSLSINNYPGGSLANSVPLE